MDDKYENLNPADDIFDHSELDHHNSDFDPEGYADRQVEPDYHARRIIPIKYEEDKFGFGGKLFPIKRGGTLFLVYIPF